MRFSIFLLFLFVLSCKHSNSKVSTTEAPVVNDTIAVKDFRTFKVLDSKYINNSEIWNGFNKALEGFTDEKYNALKPLILEANIPALQKHISEGRLTYELLTKFYLYRIRKFDRENKLSLNSVISLNPSAIKEAIKADNTDFEVEPHPIFGMPILLKDNINASGMLTTAGAVALQNNMTEDAFVVSQLKKQGAIILGKANLSEWAYFFCGDCPSGYSAIGGQTLNPYGRRSIDTGGSSSGSGVAVAANFCVAAVGSETSGSILSPSSQNSVVGLKPTIGLISRSGIVPISSTLDTSGPMTKTVIDNAIVLDAMFGFDKKDPKSIHTKWGKSFYYGSFGVIETLEHKRFGVFKTLLDDPLYVQAISDLKTKGAIIIEIEEEKVDLPDFLRLLNLDMKKDLPLYLSNYSGNEIVVKSVKDIVNFNKKDSVSRMPYGQKLFEGIIADNATDNEFKNIKNTLKTNGRSFFNKPMRKHNLNGFLSINNYHAGYAAVAEYPAITVPMGYTEKGAPKGLTFISKPLSEIDLLHWAYIYEQVSKRRKMPENYN